MPPFSVRRAQNISDELKRFSMVNGYQGIPIYADLNKSQWTNQVQLDSCPFANSVDESRWMNESTYTNALWLRDAMRTSY